MSKQKFYAPRRRNWLKPMVFGVEVPLFWFPMALAACGLIVHYLIRTEVQLWADHFLDGYRWIGVARHGAVDYTLNGQFQVESLAIEPDSNDPGATIRVDRIEVRSPGRWWLLRTQLPSFDFSSFGKPVNSKRRDMDRLPPADRLDVLVHGIDWGAYGSEFVLPEIDWVGPYSGALFEAAGCERDWWWHGNGHDHGRRSFLHFAVAVCWCGWCATDLDHFDAGNSRKGRVQGLHSR